MITKYLNICFSGNEIVRYECPRAVTGIHRIVFVLFRQHVQQRVERPGWRQNFNTRDFGLYYDLGPPVAALYFNCQREHGCGGRRSDSSLLFFIN